MKNLTLKIEKNILEETDKILTKIKTPRDKYFNEAINSYNQFQLRQLLSEKLKHESEIVSENSMKILKEFEEIENSD